MITWILKTVICSAFLLGVYFLLLEKEKMHKFNRFYLLLSIAFSLTIPFITITSKVPVNVVTENMVLPDYNLPTFDPVQSGVSPEWHFTFTDGLMIIYLLVTALLFYRFTKNLFKIYSKARKHKSRDYLGSKLVLIEDNLIPHSFLNYIFLNKSDFENDRIEKEILRHELTHVKQKHSIDIVLMEILLVLFWFNPVLYLYRRAIKLNHEFLADDAVIKAFRNEQAYQYLLIGAAKQISSLSITSQFNFSITKKRLLMMTHYTSAKTAILKQCIIIAVFFAGVLIFSTKETVAQVSQEKAISPSHKTPIKKDTAFVHFGNYAGGTKEGVSTEELNEYHNIINRTKTPAISWVDFRDKIPTSDRDRLESIFMEMSPIQQREETVAFFKPLPPLPRIVPTQTQFNNFKNSKIYGVWINEKKVLNSTLNKYVAKDFAQVFVSKLYGSAKKSRNYSYQVNLMTNAYYQAYHDQTIADKSNKMYFQGRRPIKK